jgi:predicted TIM-barrel enzyme/DNA-binding NtrC family response regulator
MILGNFGNLKINSVKAKRGAEHMHRFRVGAAVGSGMAARAAERAGADFIVALGAGKLRSMGVASPASLLPIYDAVEFTIEFAISELLPRVRLPIFVGLPLFDPRMECDAIVARLRDLGIRGLTNFPAAFHFGERAGVLEQHGLGLGREIRFLRSAAKAGLEPIGYVRNRTEANAMVSAGISTLCINFGLNPPTTDETDQYEKIDQLALAAREIVDSVRRPSRKLTIYLGGGPVSGGASMDRLCRSGGIDGFIGGSALDRAPLEKSLLNSVASFREIEVLQNRVEYLERKVERFSKRYGIVCQSLSMNRMLNQVENAIKTRGTHIALVGEDDTGRLDVARMIARRIRRGTPGKGWEVGGTDCENSLKKMFGSVRQNGTRRQVGVLEFAEAGEPIILRNVSRLMPDEQEQLSHFLTSGTYVPLGGSATRRSDARIILILDDPTGGPLAGAAIAQSLAEILKEYKIPVPPLRDRIEDIPLLVRNYAAEFGVAAEQFQTPIMRTLLRHNWPGNLSEFRLAIRWLVEGRNLNASEEELIAHIGYNQKSTVHSAAISQRDRIVQALLLNNLSRSKTADYLGISRKTLYNQIKKFEILS